MDDRADIAIGSIEHVARRHRVTRPCWGYEAVAKDIDICECGWNEAAHLDRLHALAIDYDAEWGPR